MDGGSIQYNTTQVPVNQAIIVSNTSDVFSLGVIDGGAGSGCRYGFFSEFSGKIDVNAGIDRTCAPVKVPPLPEPYPAEAPRGSGPPRAVAPSNRAQPPSMPPMNPASATSPWAV